jgi:hypothetical protein
VFAEIHRSAVFSLDVFRIAFSSLFDPMQWSSLQCFMQPDTIESGNTEQNSSDASKANKPYSVFRDGNVADATLTA